MNRWIGGAVAMLLTLTGAARADLPRPFWEKRPERPSPSQWELERNRKDARFEVACDPEAKTPVLVIPRSQLPENAKTSALPNAFGVGATALAGCVCVLAMPWRRKRVLWALGLLAVAAGSVTAWATPPLRHPLPSIPRELLSIGAEIRIVPQGDVIRLILPKDMLVEP